MYGSTRQRKLYVIPKFANGALTGTATSGFTNLEAASPTAANITGFAIDANRLRGPSGGASSGGGRTSTPEEFFEWGEDEAYNLGSTPSTTETTVTAAIRYTNTGTGLHAITDLVLNNMVVGARIAVIYEQGVTGLGKLVYRLELGDVTSVGEISDDQPSTMTFGYNRVGKRTFVVQP